ncbi:MAG: helix-turn-helix transcriptional regulator [Desulfosporosinus sp.]|nr:helix-turn-helix transcriptional regulator [Desulfosporosinus sp.]
MQVGSTIREYRKKIGMSLRQMAKEAEVSAPTLSQIENNNTSPNLVTLKKIADVLGVSVISILAQEEDQSVNLVKKNEREVFIRNLTEKGNIEEEFLTRKIDLKMEAAVIKLPPGAQCQEYVSHEGEELAIVLKGKVEMNLKNVGKYELEEGDTLYYPCSIPHSFKNLLEDDSSEFMFVATPPNF